MLRIVLYAVIFYFVYRFLDSMFRPKKANAGNHSGKAPKQKVTVQYDRDKAKSKVADDVGEYVEFEEVKEDK